jgi:outer membrane protein TolC
VIQQNVASGLASPLEYRVTQNEFLQSRSGLLDAIYQHNVAVAEWDRATGRYFQFSYASPRSSQIEAGNP